LLKERRLLHNTTDLTDRSRLIRALEIELFKEANPAVHNRPDFTGSPMFGLRFQRSVIRERITSRLASRFENGMISEVEKLIQQGVTPERLKYYGLEYKYITMFLLGEISYDKMFLLLNTAIHQFSKRQMTWFRRMEKHGIDIQWLEGENGMEYNLEAMECRIRKAKHNGS
jgi:tRNA dimethylallyltransferase